MKNIIMNVFLPCWSCYSLCLLLSLPILVTPDLAAQDPGMYVNCRYLYSSEGDTLILKGFNAMIVYWDIHGEVNFPEIEKTGANCVRIFWKLDPPTPQPSDLDKVLGNCIKHHMIPIICLWDATGDWSNIQNCVNYWCSSQIAPILQKYEKHLIINIANEPGSDDMGDETFKSTYQDAVQQIRDAGLHVPLVIDADRWGRNADAVLDNGEYLVEQDPDHNLVFSWHLWDPSTWMTGTKSEIDRIINKAAGKNICFIVGEFGPCEQCDNCSNTKINWEYMIEKANQHDIGYLPWVWKWSDCHSIVNNSTGAYGSWVNAPWGEGVAVSNPYSIQITSKRPSGLQTDVSSESKHAEGIETFPVQTDGVLRFLITLREPSRVSLHIYDLTGRSFGIPVNCRLAAGINEVSWHPSENHTMFQKGVFIYKLDIISNSGHIFKTGKTVTF